MWLEIVARASEYLQPMGQLDKAQYCRAYRGTRETNWNFRFYGLERWSGLIAVECNMQSAFGKWKCTGD